MAGVELDTNDQLIGANVKRTTYRSGRFRKQSRDTSVEDAKGLMHSRTYGYGDDDSLRRGLGDQYSEGAMDVVVIVEW